MRHFSKEAHISPPGAVLQTSLFGLLVLSVSVAGCATTPFTSKAPSIPSANTAEAVGKSPEPDDHQQTTLAAVEEFLERTQQYQAVSMPQPAEGRTPENAESSPPASAPLQRPRETSDQTFANTQVTLPDTGPSKPPLAIPAVQSVTIRTEEATKTVPESIQRSATNTPLDTRLDLGETLADKLIAQLRSEAESKKDLRSEWRLRLTQLAFERDADAARVSPELSEPARSLLASLIDAGAAIRDAASDPVLPAEESLKRVERLLHAVRDRADPAVSAVALCRKVVTFGVYEEMAAEDFISGRSIQTIVYSEIANLRAEQGDDGQYATRLAARLEVLSASGESLWQRDEPEIVDRCRTRRTDFFLAQRITLPPTLPAGEYVLKVFVEDKLANRADESSRTFTIISPVSVARGKP